MRVFFCANQISLCIAVEVFQLDGFKKKDVIFYDEARCDIGLYKKLGINFISFSRWSFLKFLLTSLFKKPDEVCVPHLRGGRLIRMYAVYAKKLSAIDDGLDSFRVTPKNIVPSDFKIESKYYTFEYDTPLASWLEDFNLIHVCGIEKIADSAKKTINLNKYGVVIVESPGVETIDISALNLQEVCLIKHSNPNKSIINQNDFPHFIGMDANIALEKSIASYKGTLIVGESMTAVYALLMQSPKFKLIITLKNKSKENLLPLTALINRLDFAKLLSVNN